MRSPHTHILNVESPLWPFVEGVGVFEGAVRLLWYPLLTLDTVMSATTPTSSNCRRSAHTIVIPQSSGEMKSWAQINFSYLLLWGVWVVVIQKNYSFLIKILIYNFLLFFIKRMSQPCCQCCRPTRSFDKQKKIQWQDMISPAPWVFMYVLCITRICISFVLQEFLMYFKVKSNIYTLGAGNTVWQFSSQLPHQTPHNYL